MFSDRICFNNLSAWPTFSCSVEPTLGRTQTLLAFVWKLLCGSQSASPSANLEAARLPISVWRQAGGFKWLHGFQYQKRSGVRLVFVSSDYFILLEKLHSPANKLYFSLSVWRPRSWTLFVWWCPGHYFKSRPSVAQRRILPKASCLVF